MYTPTSIRMHSRQCSKTKLHMKCAPCQNCVDSSAEPDRGRTCSQAWSPSLCRPGARQRAIASLAAHSRRHIPQRPLRLRLRLPLRLRRAARARARSHEAPGASTQTWRAKASARGAAAPSCTTHTQDWLWPRCSCRRRLSTQRPRNILVDAGYYKLRARVRTCFLGSGSVRFGSVNFKTPKFGFGSGSLRFAINS